MAHPHRTIRLILTFVAIATWTRFSPAADLSFSRDVRPILADNCFKCHGHDEQQRKGKFRLDEAESAMKPGKSGHIPIVPGKTDESELVKRITASNPDDRMPPTDSNKRLTVQQIGTLKQWVSQGAKYEAHWAFVPPVRSDVPEVRGKDWIRTPIDTFVLARLEKEGIHPSPEADKITLLRRLYLDLIGLPPTPREVDEFVNDTSPDAYEKQVEKLLNSPHYGERWGRHWLDAARYADSDGFEKDKSRDNYFYRDWVIDAFNRDLPYNQFIIQQIAGDQLPHPSQKQLVATGFLRNAMLNEEGGVDPEQFRMDAMFDRMDAVGKSMLGLTIQCAQCHTHKFDPITQEEYYRMFAYLNNDHEAQRVVYTPDELKKIDELRRQMAAIEAKLREATPDWEKRMEQWEAATAKSQIPWTVLRVQNMNDGSQRYAEQKDASWLVHGYAPTKLTTHMRGTTDMKEIRAFRLELLNDPNLPCNGPGRSFMGTCALTEFSVEATDAKDPKTKVKVKLVKATADYGNPERELEPNFYDKSKNKRVTGPVSFAIDGKDDTAWGIDAGPGRRNQPRNAVFVAEKPISFPAGTVLDFRMKQNHGGWNSDDHMNNNLGRFRLSVTAAENAEADPVPPRVHKILAIPKAKRSPAQQLAVFTHWRTTVPFAVSQSSASRTMPLLTLLMV